METLGNDIKSEYKMGFILRQSRIQFVQYRNYKNSQRV